MALIGAILALPLVPYLVAHPGSLSHPLASARELGAMGFGLVLLIAGVIGLRK